MSEAVVRARVLKRLAQGASLSDVRIIVHVADTPRLDVLRAGQVIAERRFENFPASCNARRDAIAVAVALALERAREVEAAPTAEASAPATTTTTATATTTTTTEAAPSTATAPAEQTGAASPQEPAEPIEEASDDGDSDSALDLGAHAGAAAILEVLPGLAFAGVLGADVAFGEIRVSLSALASLQQSDDALDASISSRLLLGRALACADLTRLADIAFEGCAGALAGAAFASGDGYAIDRSTELAYVAALARGAVRFPARGVLAGRLALDGLVPLVRPSYLLGKGASDETTAVTPAPVGASLAVEVVLTLP